MDVTVVMTEAATTPGFALDYAFGNKRRTARPKQLPLPSVAESLCGWHNGANLSLLLKKVEPREANSLKLVPTAQQGRSWSNLLRKRLQALPTYFGRFSSLSSSYITLTTSTNTSSSCPTALNSPSPVCIALPTCFSSSLSVSSFTLPTTSLCSSTFSSRLRLDCNCQQIIRIATILLTCSISSSFSSSSSTNVAGHHLLSTMSIK